MWLPLVCAAVALLLTAADATRIWALFLQAKFVPRTSMK